MSERDELTGMKLVSLESTKRGFLNLCKQYDRMGHLLALEAKAISHPLFSKTTAPEVLTRIVEQYHEVGEQLKIIGQGLDDLGGNPELGPLPTFPKPGLRKQGAMHPAPESGDEEKVFVSNVPPGKGDDADG